MKSKLIIILICACISAAAIFAAGCKDNIADLEKQIADLTAQNERLEEENADLSAENERLEEWNSELSEYAAEWQAQLEELKNSNALTEEQLAEAQHKLDVIANIRWGRAEHWHVLRIDIRPEYADKEYTIEDFAPIELVNVGEGLGDSYWVFFISDSPGTLAKTAIMLAGFEFVENVAPIMGPILVSP